MRIRLTLWDTMYHFLQGPLINQAAVDKVRMTLTTIYRLKTIVNLDTPF